MVVGGGHLDCSMRLGLRSRNLAAITMPSRVSSGIGISPVTCFSPCVCHTASHPRSRTSRLHPHDPRKYAILSGDTPNPPAIGSPGSVDYEAPCHEQSHPHTCDHGMDP